jgi:hypothetical protein
MICLIWSAAVCGFRFRSAELMLILGKFASKPWQRSRSRTQTLFFELKKIGDLRGNWDRERLGRVIFNLVVNAVIRAAAKQVRSPLRLKALMSRFELQTKAHPFLPIDRRRFSSHFSIKTRYRPRSQTVGLDSPVCREGNRHWP